MPTPSRHATLFVSCLVDQIYPEIGLSAVDLLERHGVTVHVPQGLTCCGQMAFNAGFRDDARSVAGRTLEILRGQGDVVLPSGSCTAMIRHLYHELFKGTAHEAVADELVGRTYELTEYLVDVLGVTNVGARFDGQIAYHDACHGLRFLGLAQQARTLLNGVEQAELVPLQGCDECCGFGGLFAVKMADISEAMLKRKVAAIEASGADLVVLGDVSCMIQIAGGLKKAGSKVRTRHIAEVLANRVEDRI
jgi:L-lactate dehydrogenase complex protein LldE